MLYARCLRFCSSCLSFLRARYCATSKSSSIGFMVSIRSRSAGEAVTDDAGGRNSLTRFGSILDDRNHPVDGSNLPVESKKHPVEGKNPPIEPAVVMLWDPPCLPSPYLPSPYLASQSRIPLQALCRNDFCRVCKQVDKKDQSRRPLRNFMSSGFTCTCTQNQMDGSWMM